MIDGLNKFPNYHVYTNFTLSNQHMKNANQKTIKEKQQEKDNPFQKANVKNAHSSEIDALIKEKESLEKAKQDFSKNSDTMDQKEYQKQLKEYDKQIQDINKQIQEAKLKEQKEKNDKAGSKNNNISDSNNSDSKSSSKASESNSDKADELMNNLMINSNYFQKSKSLNSLKKFAASTKKVVEAEIEDDAGRGRINKYDIRLSKKLSDGISRADKELNKLGKQTKAKTNSEINKNKDEDNNNKSIDSKKSESVKSSIKNKLQKYDETQNYYKTNTNLDSIA